MNKRISKRIVWSIVAGLGVLAIVAAVFLLAGPTAYAAQVGGISVSEEELETEIKSCVMLGKTAADLHELTYAVASVKVMREQIQGTEYDLPEGYEKEIRKESREKANDDSAELTEQLQNWKLTREELADILYSMMLDTEIQSRYVQMMAPKAVAENPDETDPYALVEKIDAYVEEIVAELPEIQFNQDAVKRIEAFAAEKGIEFAA